MQALYTAGRTKLRWLRAETQNAEMQKYKNAEMQTFKMIRCNSQGCQDNWLSLECSF